METSMNTFTIDIRRLRVLRELRQRGTIAATAKALFLTPSAISQQIAALGREIGVPLLTPQGRNVRLTQQAELLLEHAVAIDAELERARTDLAAFEDGAVGRVVLGAFATAITGLVAPALERLQRERPRLRLSVHEIGAACFTLLDRGELDLVVTVDHRGGPARGDRRYVRWDLLDDKLLVALPRRHPLAAKRSIDLLSLAGEPWIVGGTGGPCQEVGLAACAGAGFAPEVVHGVDDYGALLRLVAAGCGVGLVPELAVGRAPPPGVVLRPPSGTRPCRHLYAAVRAGAERSPCIAPVIAAILTAAQERSAASAQTARAARREGATSMTRGTARQTERPRRTRATSAGA
jgi:DNA-binding transcriptional LysR family regulator